MVILTSLAKLEVLCSNQSVTGGLIRPTKISLPSNVLISAAGESKALIQISINHSLHYFINWPRHKAIYFSWFGPELFCLLFGPPGFNCWFSFAPVFQWCCSTPQGSPGVGRNTFLSSPHLCFITVFICDLFASRDDPLMSSKTSTRTEQLYVLSHDRS